jgi:D-glycero-alpha-D-manno-heptose-7-phosphate kinase
MRRKKTACWEATAPVRVDLAGGTIDIYPLEVFAAPALTVNAALSLFARVRLTLHRSPAVRVLARDPGLCAAFPSAEKIPKGNPALLVAAIARHYLAPPAKRRRIGGAHRGGADIEIGSEAPRGTGLGGSSALGIALHAAFRRALHAGGGPRRIGKSLVREAQTVECHVIGAPTGVQDYYPALYGGAQVLWYRGGAVEREPLPHDSLSFLESVLVLAYTGQSRLSASVNWRIFKAAFEGRLKVRDRLQAIGEAAFRMREAILERSVKRLARAMAMEWEARRRLARGIETERMRRLIFLAKESGALAAKACGAGGGGCVVFVIPEGRGRRELVEQALSQAGASVLPVRLARRGLRVRKVFAERAV